MTDIFFLQGSKLFVECKENEYQYESWLDRGNEYYEYAVSQMIDLLILQLIICTNELIIYYSK